MARSKPKAPCQAATLGEGFFGLPKKVIQSPAYRDLSVHARAVLIEIGARMDGFNNGKIGIDQRTMREALGCSFRKVVQALAELVEHGFVEVAVEGRWTEKMAREYRLTFVSMPRSPATNDYLQWTPREKLSATDAVAAKGNPATDAVATPRNPATDAVTAKIRNSRKTVVPVSEPATDGVAHIIKPFPSPERGGPNGHETPSKDPENTGGDFSASDVSPQLRALVDRMAGRA